MRDHTKSRAFELVDEIAVSTYQFTRSFPKEEIYGLTCQMRKAAVSVPSNIVEGCTRKSQIEYVHFLEIAYGSLMELRYQFDLAKRLGYTKDQDILQCDSIMLEAQKVLNGLIRSLR